MTTEKVAYDSLEQQPRQAARPARRSLLLTFLSCGAVCAALFVTSLYLFAPSSLSSFIAPCKGMHAEQPQSETRVQRLRRAMDDAAPPQPEPESPTFSTTTYDNGETSTFVYTTRPIVNPGGYTIGTLTGYVPLSTPTESPTASPTDSPPTSSTSASTTDDASASVPESTEETTAPEPTSDAETTTTPPEPSSDVSSTPTSTEQVTERPVYAPPQASESVDAPSAPPAKRSAYPAFDFDEQEMHMRHRRGINFEERDQAAFDAQRQGAGVEETSHSFDAQGETHTYYKTTRPIVNPGGYTIGTLDGAWVTKPRTTFGPSPSPSPTPKRPRTKPTPKVGHGPGELRRRSTDTSS